MLNQSACNSTLYGVETAAERYSWLGWLTFVLFTSLIGDTTILIASIKYNAFKLHDCMVVFIQHIAVGDLLITLFGVVPMIVMLIAKKWVFGIHLCYVKVYICSVGWIASSLFICLMSLCKVVLLSYPERSKFWKRKPAHMMCAGIWAASFALACILFMYIKNWLPFDFTTCNEHYSIQFSSERAPQDSWYRYLVFVIAIMATLIIIVTILLLKHLFKARESARLTGTQARWQGITTVLLTALFHCLSYLPVIVREVAGAYVKATYGLRSYTYFARATYAVVYLNIVANIFIYSFTVPSFRRFLRAVMQQVTGM